LNPSPAKPVYYLGGSPCSGKSTVAELVCQRYGLTYLRSDDRIDHYLATVTADAFPIAASLRDLSCNELWMQSPHQMARKEIALYRELWSLLWDEIERLPKPVLVEGAALLPCLVTGTAVYMVPTAEFQLHHYRQRAWVKDVLSGCDDPERAFANWMGRDMLFGRWVRQQAVAYDYDVLVVDGKTTIEDNAAWVAGALGLV
jgi:hypothetical protein